MSEVVGYREAFEQAEAEGKAEPLSVTIVSWDEPGQTVVGRFLRAELIPESRYDTQVNRWLIETDEGLVSCILGAYADKEVLPRLNEGDLVKIVYRGRKDIGNGRSVNVFDIRRIKV